jgi:hypothetical protein
VFAAGAFFQFILSRWILLHIFHIAKVITLTLKGQFEYVTEKGSNKACENDLERYIAAQETVYNDVLVELCSGKKQSHWMWFIFPQTIGLGHSSTSQYYAMKSAEEAQAYLAHQVLGSRLLECTKTVMALEGRSAFHSTQSKQGDTGNIRSKQGEPDRNPFQPPASSTRS